MIRPPHVDKGKLNKCICMCEHSILLDTVDEDSTIA